MNAMKRGDAVTVTTGDYAGQGGTIIQAMPGRCIILRPNGWAFQTETKNLELATPANELPAAPVAIPMED